MRARLESGVKYSLQEKHGNNSVRPLAVLNAIARRDFAEDELYLEGYPYYDEAAALRNVHVGTASEAERLVPNYVIRSDSLIEDTRRLLRALGCSNEPKSENVHRLMRMTEAVARRTGMTEEEVKRKREEEGIPTDEDVASMAVIPVLKDDFRHLRLMEVASVRNEASLKNAKLF